MAPLFVNIPFNLYRWNRAHLNNIILVRIESELLKCKQLQKHQPQRHEQNEKSNQLKRCMLKIITLLKIDQKTKQHIHKTKNNEKVSCQKRYPNVFIPKHECNISYENGQWLFVLLRGSIV